MNCVFPLIVALATGFQDADQKPDSRLSPENLAKVKIGMSRLEVKKLLGDPLDLTVYDRDDIAPAAPGGGFSHICFYTPKSAFLPRLTITNVAALDDKNSSLWVEQERGFCAVFDAQGRITKTQSFQVRLDDEDLVQALSRFKEAGGVAQWVSRYQSHLMFRRFNTKERRITLTKIEVLPQIRVLTLHGYDFGDDDLEAISHWKHLEGLHLINNHEVTDAGLRQLEQMPKMRKLIIWDTQVTSAGWKAIGKLSALESLEIQNSPVGDAGLEALAACKKLRSLKLIGTKVTATGIKNLNRSLPNCNIETE
jgi:hypothetical protein